MGKNHKVTITNIGGNCPVQAEGTVNGWPFYFRARGNRWSMGIGKDPVGVMFENPQHSPSDGRWYYDEAYGDEPYLAGWMSEDEARAFIERAADILGPYRAECVRPPTETEKDVPNP